MKKEIGRIWKAGWGLEAVFAGKGIEVLRLLRSGKRQVAPVRGLSPSSRKFMKELGEYLDGRRRNFSASVAVKGSPFARKVMQALVKVPYGSTITYAELARRAGSPGAARAVGSVMARNRLPLLLPCHRVVAKDGLGGYSAGIQWKKHLLEIESRRNRA